MIDGLKLCLTNRPTCPECERPTFGLLEGWRKHTQSDGLFDLVAASRELDVTNGS